MAGVHTSLYRDKENGKWAGVCAGVADYYGMNADSVRLVAIVLTIFTGPWTLLVYWAIASSAPVRTGEIKGEERPEEKKFWREVRKSPKRSTRVVRARLREIDRRLANAEAYFTSPHQRLAREIDQLR